MHKRIVESVVGLEMTKFVRVLGGVVGAGAIFFGALILYRQTFLDIVSGLSMLMMGIYFLHYSLTGRTRLLGRR